MCTSIHPAHPVSCHSRAELGVPLKDATEWEMSWRKACMRQSHPPKAVGDGERLSQGTHCFQHPVEKLQAKRRQAGALNCGQEKDGPPQWLSSL